MSERRWHEHFSGGRRMKEAQAIQEELDADSPILEDDTENMDPREIFPEKFFERFSVEQTTIDYDAARRTLNEADHYVFLHKVADMNIASAMYTLASRFPNRARSFSSLLQQKDCLPDKKEEYLGIHSHEPDEELRMNWYRSHQQERADELKIRLIEQELNELEKTILAEDLDVSISQKPSPHHLITMAEVIHTVHEKNDGDQEKTMQQFEQKQFGRWSIGFQSSLCIELCAMTPAEQEYAASGVYSTGQFRGLPDIHARLLEESGPNPFAEPYLDKLKQRTVANQELRRIRAEIEENKQKLHRSKKPLREHEEYLRAQIQTEEGKALEALGQEFGTVKERIHARHPDLSDDVVAGIIKRQDQQMKKYEDAYKKKVAQTRRYYQGCRDALAHPSIPTPQMKKGDPLWNDFKLLESHREGWNYSQEYYGAEIKKLRAAAEKFQAVAQENEEFNRLKRTAELHASPLEKRLGLAALYTEQEYDASVSPAFLPTFAGDLLTMEITKEMVEEYWQLHLDGKSPDFIQRYAIARTLLAPEEITDEFLETLDDKLSPVRLLGLARANTEHGALATADQLFHIEPLIDAEQYAVFLQRGYKTDILLKYPWLIKSHAEQFVDRIPDTGRSDQEAAWCSKHAVVQPEGWNRKRVGEVMLTRLKAGIDGSLHDASYWLTEFNAPESLPDGTVLRDKTAEIALLATMRSVGDDVRSVDAQNQTALKKALQKYRRWNECFFDSSTDIPYRAIMQIYEQGQNAPEWVTLEALQERAWNLFHAQFAGTDEQHMLEIKQKLTNILDELKRFEQQGNAPLPTPALVGPLRKLAQERVAFTNDAQTWVQTHATTPRVLLTKAWRNRRLALSDGCQDNPRQIETWAKINSLKISFAERSQNETLPANISEADLETYKDWIQELVRHYDGNLIIDTLSSLKEKFNPSFEILPIQIDLGEGWIGEVLKKDDPRGMTIGPDTGCCMTLEGAAKSCIEAGYTKSEYGFFLLTRNKKVVAQSFLYVNKKDAPEVIVCDNIEANEGRNVQHVVKMYQHFFQAYQQALKEASGAAFRRVHLGTGYTEVGMDGLQKAEPIRMPHKGIYTDAKNQRK